MFFEIVKRLYFWSKADRIGPDIPTTHWKLYFSSTMKNVCKKKFKYFSETSDFRPGAYAVYCSNISLGKNVVVRPGTMLFASDEQDATITIEDDVMMGSGVHIYVTTHRFDDPDSSVIDQGFYAPERVVLKKGCWIGANSIILPGVTIGENSVVGAGSIVTKDIPPRVLAVGNPARVIRSLGAKK